MKTLLFAFILVNQIFLSQAGAQNHSPIKIFLEISPTIDVRICGAKTMKQLAPLTHEAFQALPKYQSDWNNIWGPKLLGETLRIINHPFSRKEKTALLMICNKWKAIGTPLMLQFWIHMPSTRHFPQTTSLKLPLDESVFHTYLFHELLHPHVNEIIPFNESTPLKRRFENEKVNIDSKGLVIAHIHLMAVQKKVLLNLGLDEEYRLLRQVDEVKDLATGKYILPAYKRAWEIVDLVGEDALIEELQNALQNPAQCSSLF